VPPRWKFAVVVWLAIYPSLTLLVWLAEPEIAHWPLALRTLVFTVVLVPWMVFLALPVLQRLLGSWLRRADQHSSRPRVLGRLRLLTQTIGSGIVDPTGHVEISGTRRPVCKWGRFDCYSDRSWREAGSNGDFALAAHQSPRRTGLRLPHSRTTGSEGQTDGLGVQ
jgi:hypothetical protein